MVDEKKGDGGHEKERERELGLVCKIFKQKEYCDGRY